MPYQVNIVQSKPELKDFLSLPQDIYGHDPAWVPPVQSEVVRTLDAKLNPYFKSAFIQKYVCYRNSEPVARAIAVINPRHWEKFNKRTAFFGFFESVDDQEAVNKLFRKLSDDCRLQGCEFLEGPLNPNHYSELGLLVKNFTTPVFFETYNPPYYSSLLKGAGFNPYYTIHTRVNNDAREYLKHQPVHDLSKIKEMGYTMRSFSLLHMKRDLECIREVFNDAFADNWHFLAVSREEYKFLAKSLFLVTRPGLIKIIEHHGQPAGVVQCMPNVNPILKKMNGRPSPWDLARLLWNRHRMKELVIFAVGIKKTYQNKIVSHIIYEALRDMVKSHPVLYTTWMSNDNIPVIKVSETLGLKPYKWFDLYSKTLNADVP